MVRHTILAKGKANLCRPWRRMGEWSYNVLFSISAVKGDEWSALLIIIIIIIRTNANFPHFYGIQSFITEFSISSHWFRFLAPWNQPTFSHRLTCVDIIFTFVSRSCKYALNLRFSGWKLLQILHVLCLYEVPRQPWPPSDGSGYNWWRLQILKFRCVQLSPAFFHVFSLAFKIPVSTFTLITAFIFCHHSYIIIIIIRHYGTFCNKH